MVAVRHQHDTTAPRAMPSGNPSGRWWEREPWWKPTFARLRRLQERLETDAHRERYFQALLHVGWSTDAIWKLWQLLSLDDRSGDETWGRWLRRFSPEDIKRMRLEWLAVITRFAELTDIPLGEVMAMAGPCLAANLRLYDLPCQHDLSSAWNTTHPYWHDLVFLGRGRIRARRRRWWQQRATG